MVALLVVLALFSATRVGGQQSGDVVWYIDPTSTADHETCGHEASQPCSSLEVVFQESLLFNSSSACYTSLGDQDGRTSTTVFLMGPIFVPPLCIHNWQNLHVSDYPLGEWLSNVCWSLTPFHPRQRRHCQYRALRWRQYIWFLQLFQRDSHWSNIQHVQSRTTEPVLPEMQRCSDCPLLYAPDCYQWIWCGGS